MQTPAIKSVSRWGVLGDVRTKWYGNERKETVFLTNAFS